VGKQHKHGHDLPQGEIWLFDADGSDLGFVAGAEASELARLRGLDLVRLDHLSSPPRFGLRDAGEYQADAARADRMARAGAAKEVRVRVATGAADLETRRKHAESLLQAGYRVKLRVELDAAPRGNPAPARAILDSLIKDLAAAGSPEARPRPEKGAVSVTLAPR
jgi:translation initiation factor IF-3